MSYLEKVDLICISGTQIYCHYNLPVQSVKGNLLMPNKSLKTHTILKKYQEYRGIKTVIACLLLYLSLMKKG